MECLFRIRNIEWFNYFDETQLLFGFQAKLKESAFRVGFSSSSGISAQTILFVAVETEKDAKVVFDITIVCVFTY